MTRLIWSTPPLGISIIVNTENYFSSLILTHRAPFQRRQPFANDSPAGMGRATWLADVPNQLRRGRCGDRAARRILGLRTFVEILANGTRLTRDPVKRTSAPDSALRALMAY